MVFMSGFLLLQGCASMKSAVGKSTFDPSTYGTSALIKVVRDSSATKTDAFVAARELRSRSIASVPDDHFSDIITNKDLRPEARVEVIEMLSEKSLPQFKDDYFDTALSDANSRVAEAAGMAYYPWAEDLNEKELFLLTVLKDSVHANLRTRAAQALKGLGPNYLADLIKRLEMETSASAAYAICEALADYQTEESIGALGKIANDVERKFDADSHLGDANKIDADGVRMFCVKALESMTIAPY